MMITIKYLYHQVASKILIKGKKKTIKYEFPNTKDKWILNIIILKCEI